MAERGQSKDERGAQITHAEEARAIIALLPDVAASVKLETRFAALEQRIKSNRQLFVELEQFINHQKAAVEHNLTGVVDNARKIIRDRKQQEAGHPLIPPTFDGELVTIPDALSRATQISEEIRQARESLRTGVLSPARNQAMLEGLEPCEVLLTMRVSHSLQKLGLPTHWTAGMAENLADLQRGRAQGQVPPDPPAITATVVALRLLTKELTVINEDAAASGLPPREIKELSSAAASISEFDLRLTEVEKQFRGLFGHRQFNAEAHLEEQGDKFGHPPSSVHQINELISLHDRLQLGALPRTLGLSADLTARLGIPAEFQSLQRANAPQPQTPLSFALIDHVPAIERRILQALSLPRTERSAALLDVSEALLADINRSTMDVQLAELAENTAFNRVAETLDLVTNPFAALQLEIGGKDEAIAGRSASWKRGAEARETAAAQKLSEAQLALEIGHHAEGTRALLEVCKLVKANREVASRYKYSASATSLESVFTYAGQVSLGVGAVESALSRRALSTQLSAAQASREANWLRKSPVDGRSMTATSSAAATRLELAQRFPGLRQRIVPELPPSSLPVSRFTSRPPDSPLRSERFSFGPGTARSNVPAPSGGEGFRQARLNTANQQYLRGSSIHTAADNGARNAGQQGIRNSLSRSNKQAQAPATESFENTSIAVIEEPMTEVDTFTEYTTPRFPAEFSDGAPRKSASLAPNSKPEPTGPLRKIDFGTGRTNSFDYSIEFSDAPDLLPTFRPLQISGPAEIELTPDMKRQLLQDIGADEDLMDGEQTALIEEVQKLLGRKPSRYELTQALSEMGFSEEAIHRLLSSAKTPKPRLPTNPNEARASSESNSEQPADNLPNANQPNDAQPDRLTLGAHYPAIAPELLAIGPETSQNQRYNLARRAWQKDEAATIANFKSFGLTDPTAIADLVTRFAEFSGLQTAHYFKNFGITDQGDIKRIAALCAKQDPFNISERVHNFGITDQRFLIKLALSVAQTNADQVAESIEKFGLMKQADRKQVALACAAQASSSTARNFKKFGLDNPADIKEVVLVCAQELAQPTVRHFQNFGLTRKSDIIEVALACAKQSGTHTAANFERLGLTDPADVMPIALACIAQNAKGTIPLLHHFAVHEQAQCKVIALAAVRKNPSVSAERFKHFNLKNDADIKEVALEIAKVAPSSAACRLIDFELNLGDLKEVAMQCIHSNAVETADCTTFMPFEPHDMLDLAIESAVVEPNAAAEFLEAYQIAEPEQKRSVLLAALNSPRFDPEKISLTPHLVCVLANADPEARRKLELTVPWTTSIMAIQGIQQYQANAENDPWRTELQYLLSAAHRSGLLDTTSRQDGEHVKNFVRRFGLVNSRILFATFLEVERAGSLDQLSETTRSDLAAFLGKSIATFKTTNELLDALEASRREFSRLLVNNDGRLLSAVQSKYGEEILLSIVGNTNWITRDSKAELARQLSASLAANPGRFALGEAHQEVSIEVREVHRFARSLSPNDVSMASKILENPELKTRMSQLKQSFAGAGNANEWEANFDAVCDQAIAAVNERIVGLEERMHGELTERVKAGLVKQREQLLLSRTQLIALRTLSKADPIETLELVLKLPEAVAERTRLAQSASAHHALSHAPAGQQQLVEDSLGRPAIDHQAVCGTSTFISEYLYPHYLKGHDELGLSAEMRKELLRIWGLKSPEEHPVVQSAQALRNLDRAQLTDSTKTRTLTLVPSKTFLRVLSGDLGDACYTSQHEALADGDVPGITAYGFVANRGTPEEKIRGTALAIETAAADGNKVLLVRANNPAQALASQVNTDSLVRESLNEMIALAKRLGCKYVVVPLDSASQSSSNRPFVSEYYRTHFSEAPTLELRNEPETNFNGYPNWDPKGANPVVVIWTSTDSEARKVLP